MCRSAQGRAKGLAVQRSSNKVLRTPLNRQDREEKPARSLSRTQGRPTDAETLLLSRWSGGLRCRRGLRLYWLGLHTLEYRGWAASPRCIDRQRDGSDHERHRGPRRSLGKRAGRPARTERRLAALPAESRGNIAALSALQQNNHNNEETDQDVDGSDQINHRFGIFLTFSSDPVESSMVPPSSPTAILLSRSWFGRPCFGRRDRTAKSLKDENFSQK